MANLDSWVEIPPYAMPIGSDDITQAAVAPPPSPRLSRRRDSSASTSSLKGHFTNAIMSAALNMPTHTITPSDPRKTAGRLLSTRAELSIPITAVNFRRVCGWFLSLHTIYLSSLFKVRLKEWSCVLASRSRRGSHLLAKRLESNGCMDDGIFIPL